MYGVVLWSDTQDQKAVIWCEDHGDLAFYRQPEGVSSELNDITFDAGDWVQFEMTTDRHLRFAHNPQLVSQGMCPDLAGVVNSMSPKPVQSVRSSAEIIPLAAVRAERGGSLDTATTVCRA